MKKMYSAAFFALSVVLICDACNHKPQEKDSAIRFTLLPSLQTGISFTNTVVDDDSNNLITNEYIYTGSGVGIGDFNNDNLPDVFFGGNQKPSALYVNKGSFQFEEVTQKAGINSGYWATGVSVVDINNDGLSDIYVCVSGNKDPQKRKNKLYVNKGNLQFKDEAEAYGLADTSYSTQAVFIDYDKDGDLDMYLMNHLLYARRANDILEKNFTGHDAAADKLFRNEGIIKDSDHPVYKDVSAAAGIKEHGYGLGIVVSDVNGDNWPDMYVANDYIANDLLWINNQDGTFSNRISTATRHQSYSSMGVDAGDVNNDGLPDIASLDMMPETNERKKMMFSFMNFERNELEKRMGYEPQFIRNMLQVNNGLRNVNDTIEPFFSEVGQLAGIHETDWSWSVLMADFDNDGWKDIHITNGMAKDMLNNDFVSAFKENPDLQLPADPLERNKISLQKLNEYGSIELNNYCFRNNGDLSFSNVSAAAGIATPSLSTGAAYADLDNDGDLDLLVNNINKEAFVLRNEAQESRLPHNFVALQLKGDSINKNGYGAKLMIYAAGKVQLAEQNPVRGYTSSVDQRLHIGLGNITAIDSIVITWPNNKQQVLKNVPVNKTLVLEQKNAAAGYKPLLPPSHLLFTDVTNEKGIDFTHKETFFSDYSFQRLLPQKYSQLGPFIAEGDVNGDGLADFFIGGAYNQSGRFYLQQKDGRFTAKDLTSGDKPEEDLGCLLFDADSDKDLDLFINSGGYEYEAGSPYYMPRLYKNDGRGNFSLDVAAIPKVIYTSAQSVIGGDYDGDGDTDLFIGGRVSPNQYPVAPHSYILQNNGGQFMDVTEQVSPQLAEAGMITAAVWTDFNGDKTLDLVISGEWMPVRFFRNKNGKLHEVTEETGLKNMQGQWRSLAEADLDKDGDMDLVAGNLGLNNKYKASHDQPIKLFAKDMDENGTVDPILCYYIINKEGKKELYPAIDRGQFAMQVPAIKKKFLYHADYAKQTANTIFSKEKEDLQELVCEETRSCWIENKGAGKFEMHVLPQQVQWSPVNAIVCTDVDSDGQTDIILAGNEYQAEVMTGSYDASYGLILKGNGKGAFIPLTPASSGFIIAGDVKDLKLVTTSTKERIILAALNDDRVRAFKINK